MSPDTHALALWFEPLAPFHLQWKSASDRRCRAQCSTDGTRLLSTEQVADQCACSSRWRPGANLGTEWSFDSVEKRRTPTSSPRIPIAPFRLNCLIITPPIVSCPWIVSLDKTTNECLHFPDVTVAFLTSISIALILTILQLARWNRFRMPAPYFSVDNFFQFFESIRSWPTRWSPYLSGCAPIACRTSGSTLTRGSGRQRSSLINYSLWHLDWPAYWWETRPLATFACCCLLFTV